MFKENKTKHIRDSRGLNCGKGKSNSFIIQMIKLRLKMIKQFVPSHRFPEVGFKPTLFDSQLHILFTTQ